MLRAEIEAKVVGVVAKQFDTTMERVKLSTSFRDDLGADSLDSIELIMDLEDAFDLTIPDDVAGDIKKVEDAVVYIESKLKK